MSQGPQAEISINSQGCRGRENNGIPEGTADLESWGLSSFGRGVPNIASPRKHRRPALTWLKTCLNAHGAEGKQGDGRVTLQPPGRAASDPTPSLPAAPLHVHSESLLEAAFSKAPTQLGVQ